MKQFFFDLETTGLDWGACAIHQLAALIVVDGKVVNELDLRLNPLGFVVDDEALKVGGVTKKQVFQYPPWELQMDKLIKILDSYINKFDPKDKFFLVGWNNKGFDNFWLKAYWDRFHGHKPSFNQRNNNYFNSYFWGNDIDVQVLASHYFALHREVFDNFKLQTVYQTMFPADKVTNFHDGLFDVKCTYKIYNYIVTNGLPMLPID